METETTARTEESTQVLELAVISEPIIKELQKESVTEKALRDMAAKCLSFKMTDPNDKTLYTIIEENRKQVKRTRLVIQKAYDLRTKALKDEVKLLSKDCDAILGLIAPAEKHLQAQSEIYETEQERKRNEEAERLKAEETARQNLITERQKALAKLGAVLSSDETAYTYGNVNVAIIQDGISILEMPREQWAPILQLFVDEALLQQEEKKKADALKAENDAKNKKQAEQLAALKAKQHKYRCGSIPAAVWDGARLEYKGETIATEAQIENSTDEEWETIAKAKNAYIESYDKREAEKAKEAKIATRKNALHQLGFVFNAANNGYMLDSFTVPTTTVVTEDSEVWNATFLEASAHRKAHDARIAEERAATLRPDKEKLIAFHANMETRCNEIADEIGLTTKEGQGVLLDFLKGFSDLLGDLKTNVNNLK